LERPLPITTTLLLDSLRDESRPEGWEQFSARYWPVLAGFARKLGLSEADAADAAQWTLMEFLREFRAGRYERARGRLSSFVVGIARNRILTLRRQARRGSAGSGGGSKDGPAPGDSADQLPDDATMTDMWENERRRAILEDAVAQLRGSSRLSPSTFRAFELVALRGVPATEAAAQSGLSVEEVYVARSRCTKRLRELVEELTRAWNEDG
jgi:RNA polymerase sigma-70 factor (ECF subfamily)